MRLLALWLMFAAVLLTAGCGSREGGGPPSTTGHSGDELPGKSQGAGTSNQGGKMGESQSHATAVHHRIILLDDSLSMGAAPLRESPYDRALAFLQQLATLEPSQGTTGTLSLLRFSQAARGAWDVRSQLAAELPPGALAQAATKAPGFTAAGPQEALAACQQQVKTAKADDRFTIYMLSDFRNKDWPDLSEARKQLAALAQRDGVQIVLVPCAVGNKQNMGVEALQLASLPLPGQSSRLDITLRNHGPNAIGRPTVRALGQQQTGGLLPNEIQTLFGVVKPRGAGRLSYTFEMADSAPVIIEAELVDDMTLSFSLNDALAADNTRYLYFEVPETLRVLIADELAADVAPGRLVAAALSPLPEVATGFAAVPAGPSALEKPLDEYASVVVSNVPRLTASAVANLRRYVEDGGVLVYFASKDASARYLTSQLYDEGRGLLPFPVEDIATLPPATANQGADDAKANDEPPPADVQFEPGRRAFAVFTDEQFGGAFQQSLRIARYLKVPPTWQPGEGVQVLARLRDGSPLIVEQRLGQGRAIYILTAIDSAWTNWMSQPSWVVFNLELQSELHPLDIPSYVLGQPLRVALDGGKYQPRASWSKAWPKPEGERPEVQILNARSGGIADGRPLWSIELNPNEPGVYELILETLTGESEARYYAWNVDPAEGDLTVIDPAELAATAAGKIRVEPAKAVAP